MNAVSTKVVLPFLYGIPKGRLFCDVVLSHFTVLSTTHLPFSKLTPHNGKFASCTLATMPTALC
jgi:hypothetical protein